MKNQTEIKPFIQAYIKMLIYVARCKVNNISPYIQYSEENSYKIKKIFTAKVPKEIKNKQKMNHALFVYTLENDFYLYSDVYRSESSYIDWTKKIRLKKDTENSFLPENIYKKFDFEKQYYKKYLEYINRIDKI